MRLIDVDNFLKRYSKQIPGDTIDAIDLRLALLNEPEVNAIPMWWTIVYRNELIEKGDYLGVETISEMLKKWSEIDTIRKMLKDREKGNETDQR